jgi:hypothetical protein
LETSEGLHFVEDEELVVVGAGDLMRKMVHGHGEVEGDEMEKMPLLEDMLAVGMVSH